jgi:hypothetical protein
MCGATAILRERADLRRQLDRGRVELPVSPGSKLCGGVGRATPLMGIRHSRGGDRVAACPRPTSTGSGSLLRGARQRRPGPLHPWSRRLGARVGRRGREARASWLCDCVRPARVLTQRAPGTLRAPASPSTPMTQPRCSTPWRRRPRSSSAAATGVRWRPASHSAIPTGSGRWSCWSRMRPASSHQRQPSGWMRSLTGFARWQRGTASMPSPRR